MILLPMHHPQSDARPPKPANYVMVLFQPEPGAALECNLQYSLAYPATPVSGKLPTTETRNFDAF